MSSSADPRFSSRSSACVLISVMNRYYVKRYSGSIRKQTSARLERRIFVTTNFRIAANTEAKLSSSPHFMFKSLHADDLSFEVRALWPPTMTDSHRRDLELAVAEGVADVLLEGVYQHSRCRVVLAEVRYDEIESTVAAFLKAAASAMRSLLSKNWTPVGPPRSRGDS